MGPRGGVDAAWLERGSCGGFAASRSPFGSSPAPAISPWDLAATSQRCGCRGWSCGGSAASLSLARVSGLIWGTYLGQALYVGSSLKTGHLLVSVMTKASGWLWGTYVGVALYVGTTLKTGDLVIRFGVAILLFFVVPGAFYALTRRLGYKRAPDRGGMHTPVHCHPPDTRA